MSNAQAICTSFKAEVQAGIHALGTTVVRASTNPDNFKAALFKATASLGAATTVYNATNEVSGAGYTAGGIAVTNANPPATGGTTGYWTPSADLQYVGVTLADPFDAVQLYNASQGNKSVSIHTFGAQTITAGTFQLSMPTNDQTNALLRLT